MGWNKIKRLFSKKKRYSSKITVVPEGMREEPIKSESLGNRKYIVNGNTIFANNHADALRQYKKNYS